MPLSGETFNEQVRRLIGHYRPGEPTDRFPDWMDEMYTAFLEGERVTDASFASAVTACIKTRTDHRLPLVAELRMYVETEWLNVRRERERALLPPAPPPVKGYPREEWNWNVAIGSLRQRDKNDSPTDAEIRARVDEPIDKGRLKRPDSVPVLTAPEWPKGESA